MAILIKRVGTDEVNNIPLFNATDLATNEPISCKNWFEKSKNKYHIILGHNSANRKYIAHNEIMSKANANEEYVAEDKTSGPRVLGTSKPDTKLIPYMTETDRADYEAILARAMENRTSQKVFVKISRISLTDEEKLMAKIKALQARLLEKQASALTPEVSASSFVQSGDNASYTSSSADSLSDDGSAPKSKSKKKKITNEGGI